MRHDSTLIAARIMGPLLIIAGVMLITQTNRMLTALGGFLLNDALLITGGFISLIIGLVLITLHQRWDTISGSIITLIGYVATIRGGVLLLAPTLIHQVADVMVSQARVLPIVGCVMALLGVWLGYTGYISGTLRADTGR